ncbi:hypothetical protein JOC94_002370 [Bacillus thermophilus]|uniref:Uncharacterized protein n=2 Tax=Siminovitchia TaxID=2837510 RepID=A0A429XAK7_SIMTE|nr:MULTISPECIES: hypothetical protein [Siminovitchia]MBM7715383.1 hypothetical protein [Siminovitchia thermophila]RST60093.1 hypothetical protein D5F11_008490 [Siminovitchia terrae]
MDMELGIIGMGITSQDVLENRMSFIDSRSLFQEIKVAIKNYIQKEFVFTEHKGIHYEIENKTKVELHLLNDSNSLVSLTYGVLTFEDGRILDYAKALLVKQEGEQSIIKQLEFKQDTKTFEITNYEKVEDSQIVAWSSIMERNNNDGLLKELETAGQTIGTQAFGDFCLPGGYQYCGKKCGNCKTCTAGGGGAIKNKVDGCCYIHDECYKKHSTKRCANCDRALISCVSNPINHREGPIAADAVALFFMGKCGYVP